MQVLVERIDEVYIKVYTERSIHSELRDYFTFMVPGARFNPKVKNKIWDGKIRLYNIQTNTIYAGLLPNIKEFCQLNDYEFIDNASHVQLSISREKILEYVVDKLKPLDSSGSPLVPYSYQIEAISHAIENNRAVLVSATNSGKSLIIYTLLRFFQRFCLKPGQKILIIVPTTSLVTQLFSDFGEYSAQDSWNVDDYVHKIYEGATKDTNKPIVISTWQSIYEQPKSWFDPFLVTFGDECHTFKAKSLMNIMTKLTECKHRIGLTGTLDDSQTHILTLTGLFGKPVTIVRSHEMIKLGHSSKLNIKALILDHDVQSRALLKKSTYPEEIDWILTHEKRNKLLCKLALAQKNNTLLLFQKEEHGKLLYNLLKELDPDREVYFVNGKVKTDVREQIRRLLNGAKNAIGVVSYGTFSTGINIKNINSLIFGSPSKSKIRVLQTIGRLLRKGDISDVTLYDIGDDIKYKSRENHTLAHFLHRLGLYDKEKFPYSIHKAKL